MTSMPRTEEPASLFAQLEHSEVRIGSIMPRRGPDARRMREPRTTLMPWLGRWGAVPATLVLLAGVARAQQPADSAFRARGDSVRADSVNRARLAALQVLVDSVEKARTDSLRKYQLAAVVVTGTRLSTVDERVPAQVEELNIPMIIPTPTAAPEALTTLPGISSFDDQGTPLQPEIQVRGFTLSPIAGSPQGVSVFLNGVRMNEPDAQEVNFDLLPMAAVGGSSLVRGSNVLFGRNSLGGTLLLTTRRGGATREGEIEVGGGSFGEQTYTLTGGGKLAGIDGFLAGSASDEAGWREATSARTRNVFATIGHQWGATHDSGDIALDVLYGHDKLFEAGSLPASYAIASPQLNYTPGDFFAPDAYTVILRGNAPVGLGIVRGTAFFRRNIYEQFNVNVPPPNTDALIDNRSGGGTLEWTRALRVLVPVGLTVGTDYERDGVSYRLTAVGGGSADSLVTRARVAPQENAALYAQAIITLSRKLALTGGVRVDYVRIPYTDELVDSNSGTSTYRQLAPELGLNYRVSDEVKAYAAYKAGFRAPAALELACASPTAPCSLPSALGNDPPLKPVTTHDYEGGVDLAFAHGSLDVDGFWIDVLNDIQFASPNLIQVYFLNVPRTRRAGIEMSGDLAFPGGVRLLGSYSYVAATFESTVQIATADTAPQPARHGDIMPNSPLHSWRVGVELGRQLGAIFADGELDIQGYSSQYLRGDESNQRAPIPAYHLGRLRGHVDLKRFGLQFEVENLFDDRFNTFGIEGVDLLLPPGSHTPEPFLTPSLPRRLTLTLSARL